MKASERFGPTARFLVIKEKHNEKVQADGIFI